MAPIENTEYWSLDDGLKVGQGGREAEPWPGFGSVCSLGVCAAASKGGKRRRARGHTHWPACCTVSGDNRQILHYTPLTPVASWCVFEEDGRQCAKCCVRYGRKGVMATGELF